jgi:hypothetical protein
MSGGRGADASSVQVLLDEGTLGFTKFSRAGIISGVNHFGCIFEVYFTQYSVWHFIHMRDRFEYINILLLDFTV